MKFLISFFAALLVLTMTGCGAKQEDTAANVPADNAEIQSAAQQAQAALPVSSDEANLKTVGNTSSNYINNGISTIYADEIYFIGKDEGKRGIYRMNNTTGVVESVADVNATAQDLSTIDGTVYYLQDGSIYKTAIRKAPELVKEDGTITDMCVTPKWIYYLKKDSKGLGKVFKIMNTGTGETMVNPSSDVTADFHTLTYENNMLYFSDANGIGYMYLDGTNKSYIMTGYQITDYAIYGNYVYFVYNGQIFRIKKDGTSESVPCNVANVRRINIAGEVMYVISDAGIGKMSTGGGAVTTISPEIPTSVAACGNYVFANKGLYFYHMKTDGSEAVTFE